MMLVLYYLPAAVAAGMVLGVAGSREFKRGLIRGGLNVLYLVGGMAVLGLLVALAENPAI
ncbi:MAG: hypothetical protein KF754_09635 [Planctomycetes bacterium]|nr:hypothetical protein [Planctomycetota bacterium]